MSDFISKWGALAGSIAAIIGLIAVLFKPIKKLAKKRANKRKAFEDKVLNGLNQIEHNLTSLTEDVAELQRDRLSQEHAFYMKQGWCPASQKKLLCDWKKSYTAKGFDHLAAQYEQDIMSLPEQPT